MGAPFDVDAVVIGSGAGGLACAVALAQAGQKVVVLEQHDVPGGWCHSFTLGGHRFSPGVHYLGELQPGGQMRRIYEGLGLAQDLVFCELNPSGFDRLLVGGERFDVPKGRENLIRKYQDRFPAEKKGIRRYYEVCQDVSDALDWTFRVRSFSDALKIPGRLLDVAQWGVRTFEGLLNATVQDPLLRAFLAGQCGDHGLPPSLVPAAVHASVVGHYFNGGWYPRGGAFTLPRALVRALKRAGSAIRLSTPVDRILIENEKAIGVRLKSGEEIRARSVISNADPGATFQRLVEPEQLPAGIRRKLAKTRMSTSALSLFFATDMDLRAAGMDSANIWSYPDTDVEAVYRKGLQAWDVEDAGAKLPGLFLTCTTLKDPSKQRGRDHTLEAFTFVNQASFRKWETSQFGQRPADYGVVKEALAQKMLAAIEDVVPGISQKITFRELATPLTNRHYCAATEGNLYGSQKTLNQVGPWSWPVESAISNLWMCGASTLGHGVMGATVSGLFVAKGILGTSVDELLKGRGELLCVPCENPELWPERLRRHPVADVTPEAASEAA